MEGMEKNQSYKQKVRLDTGDTIIIIIRGSRLLGTKGPFQSSILIMLCTEFQGFLATIHPRFGGGSSSLG